MEVYLKKLGHLPFSKKLRSSSILKNIEVVFHFSSSLVRIRLHTKNQLPRLSVWCGGFFTDYNTTPTKLFCFVLFCVVGWVVAIDKPEICQEIIF